jgi:hypothetical protein
VAYFGTETQISLQRRAEELYDWLYDTPGCCHPGRFCGTDDQSLLGWPTIEAILRRDKVFGFRLRPATERQAISDRLEALGCQLHTWNVFVADAHDALPASRTHIARLLPDDLSEGALSSGDSDDHVQEIQKFMSDNAIAPFSARMLRGDLGPVATPYIRDSAGRVVACAHAYFPHNKHSVYKNAAWVGLVAVADEQRGRRLGTRINARAICLAIEALGATAIYELVASDNEVSRRMVESCGPRLRPDLICGIGSAEQHRFTK